MKLIKKHDIGTGQEYLGNIEVGDLDVIPVTVMFSEESTLWEVNHYRGYRPIVDITDLEGNEIEVDVNHLNDGQFVVTPDEAITGIVTYY